MNEENNDFEFEDVTDDGAVGDKVKKLKEELKTAKEESSKNLDGWQRALADYANLKKDSTDQIKNLKEHVLIDFIEQLLPALDAYHLAIDGNRESWQKVDQNWRIGVEHIHNQLKKVLSDNNVEEIEAGENILVNSEIHEVVYTEETNDLEKDGTISMVIRPGFKIKNGRLIRPAMVKMYKFKKLEA
jgi:molecular chaperone GrpE (heat shock protein)